MSEEYGKDAFGIIDANKEDVLEKYGKNTFGLIDINQDIIKFDNYENMKKYIINKCLDLGVSKDSIVFTNTPFANPNIWDDNLFDNLECTLPYMDIINKHIKRANNNMNFKSLILVGFDFVLNNDLLHWFGLVNPPEDTGYMFWNDKNVFKFIDGIDKYFQHSGYSAGNHCRIMQKLCQDILKNSI